MNICILSRTTVFHSSSGGMETHLKTLVEGLVQREHKVAVISVAFGDSSKLHQGGATYYFLQDAPLLDYSAVSGTGWWKKISQEITLRYKFYTEAKTKFWELHQENPFDLIISQSSAGIALAKSKKFTLPLVTIIHGTIFGELTNRIKTAKTFKNWVRLLVLDIPRWSFEYLFDHPVLYKKSSAIVAVSNQLKCEFGRFYPWYKAKTQVIFNGVDSNIFHPADQSPEKFTVLFLGRVVQEKGINTLLNVAKELGNRAKFIVVGSGDDLEKFKTQAEEEHLLIDFTGSQPNTIVPSWYRKASVFFLPSRRQEGFPVTMAEALCSGLPVIASGSGGIKDAVVHGSNGFLVEDNNVSKYVGYMEELIENREKLEEMSEEARKSGVERFSKEEMIKRYVGVLQNAKTI